MAKCEGCDRHWPTVSIKKISWHRYPTGGLLECMVGRLGDNLAPERRETPVDKMTPDELDYRRRRLCYGSGLYPPQYPPAPTPAVELKETSQEVSAPKRQACMYWRPTGFDGAAAVAEHRRFLADQIEHLQRRCLDRSIAGHELAAQCRTLREITVFVPLREGLLLGAQSAETESFDAGDETALYWAYTGLAKARMIARRLAT